MKKLIVFTILLAVNHCFAQEKLIESRPHSNLRLAYTSSVIYPGFNLGFESPFWQKTSYKTKKDGQKQLVKTRYLSADLGFYHHKTFHDNFYFTIGYNRSKVREKGFFTSFSSGLGLSKAYFGGTTYVVNDNGEVSVKKRANFTYGVWQFGGGIGYDFSKQKAKPISVFYQLECLTFFPYNSTLYFRPMMEIGAAIQLQNINLFKVRTLQKNS